MLSVGLVWFDTGLQRVMWEGQYSYTVQLYSMLQNTNQIQSASIRISSINVLKISNIFKTHLFAARGFPSLFNLGNIQMDGGLMFP